MMQENDKSMTTAHLKLLRLRLLAKLKWTSEQNIILGWLLKLHANTSLFVLLLFVYSLWMDTNDVSRFFETLRMLAGAEL